MCKGEWAGERVSDGWTWSALLVLVQVLSLELISMILFARDNW